MNEPIESIKKKVIKKIRDLIEQKIIELLERKHLYQNVKIDFSEIDVLISSFKYYDFFCHHPRVGPYAEKSKVIDDIKTTENNERNEIKEIVSNLLNNKWTFVIEDEYTSDHYAKNLIDINKLIIPLPTIKINCNYCESVTPPHNPGFIGYKYNMPNLFFKSESEIEETPMQLYFLPYQCQSCKSEPIIFLISRKGFKLQLVGRSQFEAVSIPKFIPSEEKEFYSDSVIAFNTGRILASLYYLRALIEHYMRRVLKNNGKISGDELGEQYSKLLDEEFPQKFTSLKTVYAELSDKLHQFEKSEKQFHKSIAEIEKHFDLLQHLPINKKEMKSKH